MHNTDKSAEQREIAFNRINFGEQFLVMAVVSEISFFVVIMFLGPFICFFGYCHFDFWIVWCLFFFLYNTPTQILVLVSTSSMESYFSLVYSFLECLNIECWFCNCGFILPSLLYQNQANSLHGVRRMIWVKAIWLLGSMRYLYLLPSFFFFLELEHLK